MTEPNVMVVDRDLGVQVINESGADVENGAVWQAVVGQHPEVAALVRWSAGTQGHDGSSSGRAGSLFERDRYITPNSIFDQFATARDAAESDDVVSGVLETTESLAFTRMSFLSEDEDEEDVWNQIGADIDLDSRLREMWRELFIYSQFYACVWFGRKNFKVRGKTGKGNQKRREFKGLKVPLGISLLDPTKVVPVGTLLFNQERLAYVADRSEIDMLDAAALGEPDADELARQIIVGHYEPSYLERRQLEKDGIPVIKLYELNPENVWRHTATRSQYQRYATVRMKSVFELLDLKQQLRQMDRAHLIGGPLRVDQRLATPDGWKPIGAAQVGDKVFSVDGQTTEIIGVYPQGVLPMYRVTFTDGAQVICDDSHPWTVSDRAGRKRTIKLAQILDEGLFDSNGAGKQVHRHRIPVAAPLALPGVDLPLDPYLLGYLLGDGSLSQSIPKITSAEDGDYPFVAALPEGVTAVPYESRPGFAQQFGLKGSRWRLNEVTEGLRSVGLWGVGSSDKYIPDEYLWASADQRWALLQGLCDSDGHSSQAGGIEFSSISEKLADGVVQLAQSLGGTAKVSHRLARRRERLYYEARCACAPTGKRFRQLVDAHCTVCDEPITAEPVAVQEGFDRVCHRVWISLDQQEAPFRLGRKVDQWKPRRHRIVRAIHVVEQIEDAEAVCIKTARDDGLFLTEGMVVTHNTNFIILVKKGSDTMPAKPAEIANLQSQVRTVARVPVIVGDHRLSVEIITPKTDQTLQPDRYNGLDARITARLYQMFMTGNFAAGAKGDDSIKLAKVVARGMESRRHMLRRTIERKIIKPIFEANEDLTTPSKLRFHPARIDLSFDAALVQFLIDVRDRGDMSRETYLNEVNIDQSDEALLRKREKDRFDKVFTPTNVPFGPAQPAVPGAPAAPGAPKPAAEDPRTAGRNKGGNRNGGGAAPGSGQGKAPRSGTPKDKPKPTKATDELDTEPEIEEDEA